MYVIIAFDSITSEFQGVIGPFASEAEAKAFAEKGGETENVMIRLLISPEDW